MEDMTNRQMGTFGSVPAPESGTDETAMEAVRDIDVITAEILVFEQQVATGYLEIGHRLLEAKAILDHGQWLPWLTEKVGISVGWAQKFMRLAKEYENTSPGTYLGPSKALILLALSPVEREEFVAEKHMVNGQEKTADEMSKREMEKAVKELADQRAEAEKLHQHMRAMQEENRERREALEQKRVEAEWAARESAQELDALREQMAQLRAETQTVAVETVTVVDEEAVKSAAKEAREEAERKLAKKIETATKAQEKAEQDRAKAEQALSTAKLNQEEAERRYQLEREGLQEQNSTLQKKLAVASSSETAIFKVHFEAGMASINKMTEAITRMREAGDTEGANKLAGVLAKLLENALEVVR